MTDGYTKHRADAPSGFFAVEAAGLGWLDVPGGVPVAEVLAVDLLLDVQPVGEELVALVVGHDLVVANVESGRADQIRRRRESNEFGHGTLRPNFAR